MGSVKIDVPDYLAPAIQEIVATYVEKAQSYGNATSLDGLFEDQARHLRVQRYRIADAMEVGKLSRLRELYANGANAKEGLHDQYRDKAVFAVLALALAP